MYTQTKPPANQLTIENLVYSFTAPTPLLHKRLRNLALKIAAIAGFLILINAGVDDLIPPMVVKISKVIAIVCGTSAAHFQARRNDSGSDNTDSNDSAAN